MWAKLKMIKEEMWRRMHQPIPEQGKWLGRVVSGYFDYHAVPTNGRALVAFRHHVTDLWRHTLRRRSQKDRITWAQMTKLANTWLPKPIILHPWPSARFAVTHPRRGGSRMRESRTYGSVRGALSNERPLYVADCLANRQIC
jgi:RNA-directed DNA polymerase